MRRGVFWPLVLIGIGAVALLRNLGLLPAFSVTSLLGLWPVLLILLGIDIAFGRRWPLQTLAVDVVVIALALGVATLQPDLINPSLGFSVGSDCDHTVGQPSVSVPRAAATSLRLRLDGGAGTFHVAGGSTDLVDATSTASGLRLRATGTPERPDVRIDDCVARPAGGGGEEVRLRIANDVISSVTLNGGAGDFTMDLRDVKASDVTLNAGASSLTLVLPRPSGEVPIRVSSGASSVTIEVPDGVETRVTTTGALMSTSVMNSRVTSRGSQHETSAYAAAADRVTVTVTAGAGSVTIR